MDEPGRPSAGQWLAARGENKCSRALVRDLRLRYRHTSWTQKQPDRDLLIAQRPPKAPNQRDQRNKNGEDTPLEPARSAHADQLTHDESQIEAPRVDQQPLADVRLTAEVHTAHSAGLIEMSKRAFQPLTAEPK